MKKLIQDQISEKYFSLTGARTHESIILEHGIFPKRKSIITKEL